MPPIKKHLAASLARTGKEYKEVHEWIDDPELKNERHDFTRVLEFAKMFTEKYGAEAAQEYVFHLSDDLKGKFGHVIDDSENLEEASIAAKAALTYFGSYNR